MIARIIGTRDDPGGTVRYSFGPGKRNEHEHPRTVAGNCLTIEDGHATRDLVDQVAEDLRAYQRIHGNTVKGGHITHIVIALDPNDKPITDDKWRAIAEDYMRDTGWTAPDKAPVKWTAINHGRNGEGADHVHIIASRVRADGRLVDKWKDGELSKQWRVKAEKRFGLTPLAARVNAKRERARLELEPKVRAAALDSRNEAEFVHQLRTAGLDPQPRVNPKTRKATGYSVAAGDQRLGGSSIAPDLSLPALRKQWGPQNTRRAEHQWQNPAAVIAKVAQSRGDQEGAAMDTASSVARLAKARSVKAPKVVARPLLDPFSRPPPRRQRNVGLSRGR